jgi:hypothetical protein
MLFWVKGRQIIANKTDQLPGSGWCGYPGFLLPEWYREPKKRYSEKIIQILCKGNAQAKV